MKRSRPKRTSGAAAIARYYEAALTSARPSLKRKTRVFVQDQGGTYVVSNDAAARVIDDGLRATIVGKILDAVSVEKGKVLGAIGIDKATLRRREQKRTPLDVDEAAGVLRVMDLTTLATQTFGTEEKGAEWLSKPHPLLEGKSPIEIATNEYGVGRVKGMLYAIRYGGVV